MHSFKEGVISAAEDLIVGLHDGATPEVVEAVLTLPIADVDEHVLKDCRKTFRADARFGVIFCEVFQDRPQVEKRSPVDVAQIRDEEVLFEGIDEGVITRKVQVS